ncbi:TetR/AcrR family transcriptional regulator [Baekduia sp. Peel2402]|uniref:TetR/AcrR family transcriptional regulator n=1 Tax=Baekduia sp. Peel2402 TaxID=3458296 RepID=UPI00403EAA00
MTPTATPSKRTLSTAEARREAVLEAGMSVFAEKGFLGTPTTEVAKAAGISQAYLFRLFPTKTDLVLAVVERSNQRIEETFLRSAAEAKATGQEPEEVMGEAYGELLADRTMLMTQIHQFAAAASMPEVAEASRTFFAKLYDLVVREAGMDGERAHRFFATGMLLNVMAAVGAQDEHGEWASTLRVC